MRDQATWRAPGGSLRIPYLLTLIVAALLIVSSVAGLLFGQRGLYQPEPRMLAAFMSQDVISLIVGLPLLLGSLWLARRGSARGLLLWLGTLFYVAYGYAYYVFAAPFGVLFFVYVALVALTSIRPSGRFSLSEPKTSDLTSGPRRRCARWPATCSGSRSSSR